MRRAGRVRRSWSPLWAQALVYALELNGGTQYVDLAYSATWATAAWSWSGWVRSSVEILNRDRWIFGASTFAVQWGAISLTISNLGAGDGQLLVYMGTQAGTQNHGNSYTSSVVITQDVEHHVVVTFNGGTLHIWVDGVDCALSSSAALPSSMLWGGKDFRMGKEPDSSGLANQRLFLGTLRDVGMYDHALTGAEVATLRSGGTVTGQTWSGYTGAASHPAGVTASPADATGPRFTPRITATMPTGGLKVLPCGDSFVLFSWGYRQAVKWYRWTRRRKALDFVGSKTATTGYMLGDLSGDNEHSGFSGNTISAIKTRMLADIATYAPGVVIFRGGANDLTGGSTPAQVRDATIDAINAAIAASSAPVLWMPETIRGGGAQETYRADTDTLRGYTADIAAACPSAFLVDTRGLQTSGNIAGNGNVQSDTVDGLHLMRCLNNAEADMLEAAIHARGL